MILRPSTTQNASSVASTSSVTPITPITSSTPISSIAPPVLHMVTVPSHTHVFASTSWPATASQQDNNRGDNDSDSDFERPISHYLPFRAMAHSSPPMVVPSQSPLPHPPAMGSCMIDTPFIVPSQAFSSPAGYHAVSADSRLSHTYLPPSPHPESHRFQR